MNDSDGNVGIRKLNHGVESAVVRVVLTHDRKHLTLSLQKGVDDSLDMGGAHVGTLSERHDLDLAVANGVRLVRGAANLLRVSDVGKELQRHEKHGYVRCRTWPP